MSYCAVCDAAFFKDAAGGFYSNGPVDLGIAYEHNYQVRTTNRGVEITVPTK